MDVTLLTNAVAGGWDPRLREQGGGGLGGSEECVTLWAEALARTGRAVEVLGTFPEADFRHQGVRYRTRDCFDPGAARQTLIAFKERAAWLFPVRAEVTVHWSSDVEPPLKPALLGRVGHVVALSSYHARRLDWVPADKLRVIPHGIGAEWLRAPDSAGGPGEPRGPLLVYCSSPDRGLERLLQDWPTLRERHPGLELAVCYGRPVAPAWLEAAAPLLRQPGVAWLGSLAEPALMHLLSRARYWCLPLNRPDAELFCLSAVKAQARGALPVVQHVLDQHSLDRHRPGSGLGDTVRRYVPYREFLAGELTVHDNPAARADLPLDWDQVLQRFWLPLLDRPAAAALQAAPAGGPQNLLEGAA